MRHSFLIKLAFAICLLATQSVGDVQFKVQSSEASLKDALMANSQLASAEQVAAIPAQDLIATARAEYSRLLAALYERGYFGAVISIRLDGVEAASISPFAKVRSVKNVDIRIESGEPFKLGRAVIAPLASGTAPVEGFATGQVATTPLLRRAVSQGIEDWRAQGFAKAEVAGQTVTANNRQAVLNADIRLAPGRVARFGELNPTGLERMRPERVRAIAGLPKDERFHPDTTERVAERLRDTGAFSSVSLREGVLSTDGVLDVDAEFVEAPLRRFGFGAELASTEGLTLSGFWLHRNVFGGAERLRFDAEISGIGGDSGGADYVTGVQFSRPATFTADTTLGLGLQLESLDEPSFQQDSIDVTATLTHRFSKQVTGSVGVEIDRSKITDSLSTRRVTLISFPTEITWDTRDVALDARKGWYLSAGVQPFVIASSSGGARATLDARSYVSLGASGKTRLAGRLQFGTIEGGDVTSLPPDWLFFSGGSSTVRGLSYQSLGATQAGVQTGGRSFAGVSLEVRRDITDKWGAAVFTDAGYVSTDSFLAGAGDWHAGIGIGARYKTPIGAIRVDVATPIRRAGSGGNVALYIGIGQSF